MIISGSTGEVKFHTTLGEDDVCFEIVSGPSKGTKRSTNWSSVSSMPDSAVNVFDIRFLGWMFLILWVFISLAAYIEGDGRLDVAAYFSPFGIIPWLLLLKYGRRETEFVTFRDHQGQEVFALPGSAWEKEEVKSLIKARTES